MNQIGQYGIFHLDRKGTILNGSREISMFLDIPDRNIKGKTVYDYLISSEKERVFPHFCNILRGGSFITFDTTIKTSKGSMVPLKVKLIPSYYQSRVIGVIGSAWKIYPVHQNGRELDTEEKNKKPNKETEDCIELEQIIDRYELAASATRDLVYDCDLVTEKIYQTHNCPGNYLGYEPEEMRKPDFWDEKIHPEDRNEFQRRFREILNDPKRTFYHLEYRFQRADGSYAFLVDKGRILRNPSGKGIRLVGVTSDISKSEEALREVISSFKLVLRATNAIYWEIGHEALNGNLNELLLKKEFGYARDQVISREFLWYYKMSPSTLRKVTDSFLSTLDNPQKQKWEKKYQFVKTNGEIGFLVDHGFITRDKKGKATKVVGAMLDISDTNTLIEEIQEQNKLLKEIAWEQSHVVRAPLARLKGLLQYLGLEDFEEVSRAEIFKNIKSSAEELDEIVKGIISKTETIEAKTKKSSTFDYPAGR